MANEVTINVHVDGGDALVQLALISEAGKKAGQAADDTKGRFAALSGLMENQVVQSLGKAGAGFAGILGAGALGGLGAAAGVAGLGLVGFAALAAPTLDKVKLYLSESGKTAQKTWDQMDPGQRNLATSMKSLETIYKQAAVAFEPVVTSVAQLAVSTGRDLLPAIQKLAPAGAAIITGFLTPLNKLLTSDWFSNWVTQVADLAVKYAPQLGGALVQLLQVVMNLFTALGPSGAKTLVTIIQLFTQWVQALTPLLVLGSEALTWITDMMKKSPLLAAAIMVVAAAIAVATGGMNLIVPAVALAVGAIINLWDKSQTFRDIVTGAFSVVAQVVLTEVGIILRVLQALADNTLEAAYLVVKALSYIPGPTQHAMQTAAADIGTFKQQTDTFFNGAIAKIGQWQTDVRNMPKKVKLEGDITDLQAKLATAKRQLADPHLTATKRATLQADISNLQNQINAAERQLNALNGKTVYTYIDTISVTAPGSMARKAAGGVVGAAAGGARSNLVMVGEQGRELVSLPSGSTVHSNPDTERMIGGGGGPVQVILSIDPSFRRAGIDESLLQALRYTVRTMGGRGPDSVQRALGRG